VVEKNKMGKRRRKREEEGLKLKRFSPGAGEKCFFAQYAI
jgi:hypothetical protein